MSHLHERKEKVCLNCNTEVFGRYCHVCGQENIEPKESAWHLITHFVNDITHFDGKFFSSLKYLILKPGFLSAEYVKGKRASYLHPVRMYVFTSFIFFLIVLFNSGKHEEKDIDQQKLEYAHQKDSLLKIMKSPVDSVQYRKTAKALNRLNEDILDMRIRGDINNDYDGIDTTGLAKTELAGKDDERLDIFGQKYSNTRAYDSSQKQLPAGKRDGWFTRYVIKRSIAVNIKYHNRGREFQEEFKEKFVHSIPKMMFVSLPLVALLLQLLYVRRKEFFYVSHGIFIVHVYIAIFILILITYLFGWLRDLSGWSIFSWLIGITVVGMFYYLYKAMKNFYQQSRTKTVLKFFVFNLMVFVVFILLALVFVVNSLLSV